MRFFFWAEGIWRGNPFASGPAPRGQKWARMVGSGTPGVPLIRNENVVALQRLFSTPEGRPPPETNSSASPRYLPSPAPPPPAGRSRIAAVWGNLRGKPGRVEKQTSTLVPLSGPGMTLHGREKTARVRVGVFFLPPPWERGENHPWTPAGPRPTWALGLVPPPTAHRWVPTPWSPPFLVPPSIVPNPVSIHNPLRRGPPTCGSPTRPESEISTGACWVPVPSGPRSSASPWVGRPLFASPFLSSPAQACKTRPPGYWQCGREPLGPGRDRRGGRPDFIHSPRFSVTPVFSEPLSRPLSGRPALAGPLSKPPPANRFRRTMKALCRPEVPPKRPINRSDCPHRAVPHKPAGAPEKTDRVESVPAKFRQRATFKPSRWGGGGAPSLKVQDCQSKMPPRAGIGLGPGGPHDLCTCILLPFRLVRPVPIRTDLPANQLHQRRIAVPIPRPVGVKWGKIIGPRKHRRWPPIPPRVPAGKDPSATFSPPPGPRNVTPNPVAPQKKPVLGGARPPLPLGTRRPERTPPSGARPPGAPPPRFNAKTLFDAGFPPVLCLPGPEFTAGPVAFARRNIRGPPSIERWSYALRKPCPGPVHNPTFHQKSIFGDILDFRPKPKRSEEAIPIPAPRSKCEGTGGPVFFSSRPPRRLPDLVGGLLGPRPPLDRPGEIAPFPERSKNPWVTYAVGKVPTNPFCVGWPRTKLGTFSRSQQGLSVLIRWKVPPTGIPPFTKIPGNGFRRDPTSSPRSFLRTTSAGSPPIHVLGAPGRRWKWNGRPPACWAVHSRRPRGMSGSSGGMRWPPASTPRPR